MIISGAITAITMFINQIRGIINASQQAADDAIDKINEIQAKIYTNVEKKNTFTNLIDQFEDLDNKIIKTSDDLEQMDNIRAQLLENFNEDERRSMQGMTTEQLIRQAEIKTEQLDAENKKELQKVEKLFRKTDISKT